MVSISSYYEKKTHNGLSQIVIVLITLSISVKTIVVLRLDGKSIHCLFKTFDAENRFSF